MTKSEYMTMIWQAKADMRPEIPATPQCCATCEWLSNEGRCEIFGEYPPYDFIKVENDCSEWEEEIPF